MLNREVDELLVIRVAAGHAGFWGNVNQAGVLVEFREYVLKGNRVKRQSGCDFWVSQYSGQLVPHGLSGQPVEFVPGQCLAHGLSDCVIKDKYVKDDVGV